MPNTFTPNTKKGNTLGTCTLNYHGLILKSIKVMRGNEQIWLSFPSVPRKDKQGNLVMNEKGKTQYDRIIYPSSHESLENIENLVDNAVCEYIGAPIIPKPENELKETDTAWFNPFNQDKLLGFATVRYKGLCIRNIKLFKEETGIRMVFPTVNGVAVCLPENKEVAREIFELIKAKMEKQ